MNIKNTDLANLRINSEQSLSKRLENRAELRKQITALGQAKSTPVSELLSLLAKVNKLPGFSTGEKPDLEKDPVMLRTLRDVVYHIEFILNGGLPGLENSRIPKAHLINAVHDVFDKAEDLIANIALVASPAQIEGMNKIEGQGFIKKYWLKGWSHEIRTEDHRQRRILNTLSEQAYTEYKEGPKAGKGSPLILARVLERNPENSEEIESFIEAQENLHDRLNPLQSGATTFEGIKSMFHETLEMLTRKDFGYEELDELNEIIPDMTDEIIMHDFEALSAKQVTRLQNLAETIKAKSMMMQPMKNLSKVEIWLDQVRAILVTVENLLAGKNEGPLKNLYVEIKNIYTSFETAIENCQNLQFSSDYNIEKAIEELEVTITRIKAAKPNALTCVQSTKNVEEYSDELFLSDFLRHHEHNAKGLIAGLKELISEVNRTFVPLQTLADEMNRGLNTATQISFKDPQSVLSYLKTLASTEGEAEGIALDLLNNFITRNHNKLIQSEDTLKATIQYLDYVMLKESKIRPKGLSPIELEGRGMKALLSSYLENYFKPASLTEENAEGENWLESTLLWFDDQEGMAEKLQEAQAKYPNKQEES